MGGGSCASAPGGGPAQATTVDGSSTETMVSVAGLEQYAHKIVSSSIRNYVLCCCDPRPEQSFPIR